MVNATKVLNALAGTWIMLNTTTLKDGTPVPPTEEYQYFGTHPAGLLTYNPSGYMSANIAHTNSSFRPASLTFPSQANQSDADWALIGKYTLSYAGNFSFTDIRSETEGQVRHGPLIMAHVPSWVGISMIRNFTLLEGGRVLRITSATLENGGILYWGKLG